MIDGEFERSLLHGLTNDPLLQTARADQHGFVGAIGRSDLNPLQVRLELAAGDAGDLGADTAQVFGLAAGRNLVADAFRLLAKLALGHRKVLCVNRLCLEADFGGRRWLSFGQILETSQYSRFRAGWKPTPRSWRIITPLAEGVAAADPPDTSQAPADGTVFFHRSNEIVAARRLETALAADDGAERPLVDANESDEHETG